MGILDILRGRERRVSYSSGLAPISRGGRLLSGKMSNPVTARGASLRMQAMWRSFPEWKKNQLRRVMKDSDHDGVPDKFDCRPFNPRRQEEFTWEEVLPETTDERKTQIAQEREYNNTRDFGMKNFEPEQQNMPRTRTEPVDNPISEEMIQKVKERFPSVFTGDFHPYIGMNRERITTKEEAIKDIAAVIAPREEAWAQPQRTMEDRRREHTIQKIQEAERQARVKWAYYRERDRKREIEEKAAAQIKAREAQEQERENERRRKRQEYMQGYDRGRSGMRSQRYAMGYQTAIRTHYGGVPPDVSSEEYRQFRRKLRRDQFPWSRE